MRVLNIGFDPTFFSPTSVVRARMRLYASAVEELHIISPAIAGAQEIQEGNLYIHPVETGRLGRIGKLAQRARALIDERRIDVVSAQDPFTYGVAALLAVRGTRATCNVQVHTDLAELSLLRRLGARAVLRRADTIRVVSEKIKTYLIPLHLHAPITVLPIYIDLSSFQSLTHHAHPRFTKTILWIGRFESEKNPREAMHILKQVRDSGSDAGLILLGAGSLEQELRAEAEALAPYVEFPGWQKPEAYLAMADVVVSTSYHESYGASVVEALAAGVPVVSFDTGIAREAGALIAIRENFSRVVGAALTSGVPGKLLIEPLDQATWTKRWVDTLL